jgi:hypothetical protein
MSKLTVTHDMPFQRYADLPGLNASALKSGRVSMKHMRYYVEHGKEDTAAMRMGRMIHSAILEPDVFFADVVIYEGRRAGKDWEAFQSDCALKTILKPDELTALNQISTSVHSNRLAHDIIARTRHEVSAYRTDDILGDMKARLDGWDERTNAVLEIKTSNSGLTPDAFSRTQYNMGTHIQLGWINTILSGGGFEHPAFVVLGVEQKPPYDVVAFDVDAGLIERGIEEAKEIATKWRIAQTTGIYDGISSEFALLSLPKWAAGKSEEEVDVSDGEMEVGAL